MKRIRLIACILTLLLVFLCGCSEAVPPEATPLTVVGTTVSVASSATTAVTTTAATTASAAPVTATAATTTKAAATTRTTAATATPDPEQVEALLSAMSPADKVGQLFVVSLPGTELTESDQAFLAECHIGNIILFARNIESTQQLAALNTAIRQTVSELSGIPPFICVDQEGGNVMRIYDACLAPPMMAVGAAGDTQLTQELGTLMGEQLRTLGINVNLAPCADVSSNPDNPVIGSRSFGEDPELVAEMVTAYTKGLQSAGVLACLKHFPGHGDTSEDSHLSLPTVNASREELEETELVPFRAGIAAGAAMTMVGHILYPALGAATVPASLSSEVITGVLREELGFDGLVITDSLSMGAITNTLENGEACVMALEAGADLLLTEGEESYLRECYTAVYQAVESGRISEERLNEAVRRVLTAKYRYGVFSAAPPSFVLPDTERYEALLTELAEKSLTVIEGEAVSISADDTLVLSVPPYKSVLAQRTESLGAYMTRTYGFPSVEINASLDDTCIRSILSQTGAYSTVVLAVTGTGCKALAKALIESCDSVEILVLGNYYAAQEYRELGAQVVCCGYENTDYSITAAANYLLSADR